MKDDRPGTGALSRREFTLGAGRAALLVSVGAAIEWPRAEAATAAARRAFFTPGQRTLLRVLADVIVPAEDGLASAGETGAVAYLEALASRQKDVARDLRGALAALERQARARHQRALERLEAPQR